MHKVAVSIKCVHICKVFEILIEGSKSIYYYYHYCLSDMCGKEILTKHLFYKWPCARYF